MGIIMDGNGRWAKERGMTRAEGHNAGMRSLIEIVRHASNIGIRYLTVYAFSTENWKRPKAEVDAIFQLLILYVKKELKELKEENVQVNILGDWEAIPGDSVAAIRKAVSETADNTGLCFNIALNYGGRSDIVHAASSVARKVAAGELDLFEIDEAAFSQELYTAGIPDPELIIRTGGEYRLSNFLTWQSAYSELVFTELYWPDFTPEELDKALAEFSSRDRRFGGIR